MRPASAQEAADSIRELGRVRLNAKPWPETVLSAAMLVEALRELGKPFHLTFSRSTGECDVSVNRGDHPEVYEAAKELGRDLPELALAASVCSATGYSTEVLRDGLSRGSLSREKGPCFSGDLAEELESSVDPFIESTGGDSLETGSLLKDLGIDLDTRVEDLGDYGVSLLVSYLALKLVEQGASPEAVDLLLMGRVRGDFGEVRELATAAEAWCHSEGPSSALSRIISGEDPGKEVGRFRMETIDILGSLGGSEGEKIAVHRVEDGPVRKAAKVAARDLLTAPALFETPTLVYGAGFDDDSLKDLEELCTGEGWFETELKSGDLIERVRVDDEG